VIELQHTARSAAAFADGALAAASWIHSRKGVFTMDEVTATLLDPLFAGLGGARGGDA
jgi:dihydrodipicolinate reductase